THGKEENQLVSRERVIELIKTYVEKIQQNVHTKMREDLYVGIAGRILFRILNNKTLPIIYGLYILTVGIAFMFWKLSRSDETRNLYPCLELAFKYIGDAKRKSIEKGGDSNKSTVAFLCGGSGIAAVAATIANEKERQQDMQNDVQLFLRGHSPCASAKAYDADEVLVGRAGYLHGAYWLNQTIASKPIKKEVITEICQALMKRGRSIAKSLRTPAPLMYEYHEKAYLGAAHGICAILHALLESPWFDRDESNHFSASATNIMDIKKTIDYVLTLQDSDGNFPTRYDSTNRMLVHWCHGCAGAIYLFAKAFLIFREEKYLDCCRQCANQIWHHGLLRKGPGICHGVAGNGYAFLLMYRLTGEKAYLYRASKFAEFLSSNAFATFLLAPDRPYSLYEGLAGTVCFLVDLLNPSHSAFPFMDGRSTLVNMRIVVALAFILVALSVADAKCNTCNRNECECKLEIARGPPPQPFPFYKKKKCNVTKPLELKPTPDVCSCEQEYRIRPSASEHIEPKFAKSRSCECGYDQHPAQPKRKYPADIISRQLAIEYARKQNVPETELHMYVNPMLPPPTPKRDTFAEERIHKPMHHVLELKPPKRKRVHYRAYSSEEAEGAPCNPKDQSYFDICYGKVEGKEPKFNLRPQDGPVCDNCQDQSTEEVTDRTEEEDDYSPEKPTKYCSTCSKSKKKCGCAACAHSYQEESEEDYPHVSSRRARSSAVTGVVV
uniref:LanC-like protein 3 homolog n=1 Tax=Anopheles epiroticus TaxID=199890 RepID=A0A182P589_9DIPT